MGPDHVHSANSCMAGAPVCEYVNRDALEPKLRKEFDSYMSKKAAEDKKTEIEKNQRIPSVSQNSDESQMIAKASVAIIAACTGWQAGIIDRSEIMNKAKEIYSTQGFDTDAVDWSRAIDVAKRVDAQENIGCIN